MNSFPLKIRYLLIKKDWQMKDLANKVDVARQTVSAWTKLDNPTIPGHKKLKEIADALDTTVEYLLKEESPFYRPDLEGISTELVELLIDIKSKNREAGEKLEKTLIDIVKLTNSQK